MDEVFGRIQLILMCLRANDLWAIGVLQAIIRTNVSRETLVGIENYESRNLLWGKITSR